MFYLAHLYLSQDCLHTMVGDFVTKIQRNWDYNNCDPRYMNGVRLNNLIEEFSSNHPIIKRSLSRFSKNSKLSSKALFVLYDHLLAANWKSYSNVSLEDFSSDVYKTFMEHSSIFPYKLKQILPGMIKSNWLVQFRTLEGMNKSYKELGKISGRPWNMDSSIGDFINNYSLFKKDFEDFFPLLINHIKSAHHTTENIIKLDLADYSKIEAEEIVRLKLA